MHHVIVQHNVIVQHTAEHSDLFIDVLYPE